VNDFDTPHLVQVRLDNGMLLDVPTKAVCDLVAASRIANRLRRALRLPMWSPRWNRMPPAYLRFAETVRAYHSDVAKAVVEVVVPGSGEGSCHGYVPVLLLPVSMARGEVLSLDLLQEVWDRR
jgi:hypothetical protein